MRITNKGEQILNSLELLLDGNKRRNAQTLKEETNWLAWMCNKLSGVTGLSRTLKFGHTYYNCMPHPKASSWFYHQDCAVCCLWRKF